MKILIIDSFGSSKIVESQSVPSIGHTINLGYVPCPKVRDVVWFPLESTIKNLLGESNYEFIDVLVFAYD